MQNKFVKAVSHAGNTDYGPVKDALVALTRDLVSLALKESKIYPAGIFQSRGLNRCVIVHPKLLSYVSESIKLAINKLSPFDGQVKLLVIFSNPTAITIALVFTYNLHKTFQSLKISQEEFDELTKSATLRILSEWPSKDSSSQFHMIVQEEKVHSQLDPLPVPLGQLATIVREVHNQLFSLSIQILFN